MRSVILISAMVTAVAAAALPTALSGRKPHGPGVVPAVTRVSDYDVELAALDSRLAAAKNRGDTGTADGSGEDEGDGTDRAALIAYLHYRRASLSGDPDDFREAGSAIRRAVDQAAGATSDLCLLKGRLDLWFHRLPEAAADLDASPGLADTPEGQMLRADLAFQAGDLGRARAGYEHVIAVRRSWEGLARLAYLVCKTGDPAAADRLYAEAEDEITAKEMRSYAWVELQRGLLELNRGRHEAALSHYDRAARAYTGYWLIDEYRAEALAAQGKLDDARETCLKAVRVAHAPEVWQALGDLYAFAGRPSLAAPWHDRALAAYRASAARGEVQYFHHLASFYADVRPDGAEAVRWASRDLELRNNYATRDAAAWALYRAGRTDDALVAIDAAVASGVQDAHLFEHAAAICAAAGRGEEGKRFLAKAAGVNPHFQRFHLHR